MVSAVPSINIKEGKNNYKVEVPAPGIRKENFNIYTEGNKLVISCKNEVTGKAKKKAINYWQKANDGSYFFRFLALPENADSERITAKYNGILELSIPKKKKSKKKQ